MTRVTRLLAWLREEIGSFGGFLLDIDGTLVRGAAALPGAVELLAWLDAIAFPYLLVTNDANHSHEEKSALLRSAGLEVAPGRILSAGDVIAAVVRRHALAHRLVFVMGDLGRPDYAEEAGMVVTRELDRLPDCSAVIVGEENYDWQPTFNAVINFLIERPDAPFIVPNPDIYWPAGRGKIAIGAGGKAKFIVQVLEEYGVAVRPLYLGKPYGAVFDHARSRIEQIRRNGTPDRIIMVGDSLEGDIRGANRAGFFSVLVLTGITGEPHLERVSVHNGTEPSLIAGGL